MKRIILLAIATFLVFNLVGCATSNDVEGMTYDYLETQGYTKDDIKEIEIDHSVVNKVLGYNEWRIFVEFKSEPDIIFAFTYRDDEIIRQGIKSNVKQLDKDEIRAFDEKFDNGELKNTEQ